VVTEPLPQRIYRMFRRPFGAAQSVRSAIIALVLAAVAITILAIVQVARRHEVVRHGYALSRASERLRVAEELHRRLELERATLSAPERIRAMATSLGMVATPPDQVRVIRAPMAAQAPARAKKPRPR
jgi:cell division protein FtsL